MDIKPVFCIETRKAYSSITEAENETGISRDGISRVCQGKQKTAGRMHWEFINEENFIEITCEDCNNVFYRRINWHQEIIENKQYHNELYRCDECSRKIYKEQDRKRKKEIARKRYEERMRKRGMLNK